MPQLGSVKISYIIDSVKQTSGEFVPYDVKQAVQKYATTFLKKRDERHYKKVYKEYSEAITGTKRAEECEKKYMYYKEHPYVDITYDIVDDMIIGIEPLDNISFKIPQFEMKYDGKKYIAIFEEPIFEVVEDLPKNKHVGGARKLRKTHRNQSMRRKTRKLYRKHK